MRDDDELLGTAEVAELLHVERPRIGRWLALGKMPEPIARLRAGPIWWRSQIEAFAPDVESRRKPRKRVLRKRPGDNLDQMTKAQLRAFAESQGLGITYAAHAHNHADQISRARSAT